MVPDNGRNTKLIILSFIVYGILARSVQQAWSKGRYSWQEADGSRQKTASRKQMAVGSRQRTKGTRH
jgi:hypothetical protein